MTDAVDWYEKTHSIVTSLVEDLTTKDDDAMEIDAGKDKNDDRTRNKLLVGAIEALQKSFSPSKQGEDKDFGERAVLLGRRWLTGYRTEQANTCLARPDCQSKLSPYK